ncbi:BTB domain-containing protein [Aphelenchoides bicaudatus]|nr:BTB domain-containing protein [Aphelenchoides bicaudatus]
MSTKATWNSTSIEYVEDLFVFADKYLIEKLKSECSLIMRKNITKNNVLSLFILASTHNDKEFKDHLLGYIMNENDDNNWRSILKSKELLKLKLSNEQLADEISDLIFDKIAGAMSKTS